MFKFKNISSKDMKVVCEEEDNFLTKPQIINNDNLKLEDEDYNNDDSNYDYVSSNISLFVLDKTKLDEIKSWLNGKGELEYKDKITTCFFSDSYDIVRSATIYKINPSFIRLPFWFKANDDFIEVIDNQIQNDGNIYSYPIIRLEKNLSSKVELTVNDVRFSYNFPENDEYVEIDCGTGNAKYEGFYRNNNLEISWKFPKLLPGGNYFEINSGDAIVKIKRKDCWL